MIELGKGKADRDGQCREKTSKCEHEWSEGETIAFKNDKKVPICMSCALSLISRDRAQWAQKQETRTEARESYTLNHGDAAIETLLQSIAQSIGTIASELTAIREHLIPNKAKEEKTIDVTPPKPTFVEPPIDEEKIYLDKQYQYRKLLNGEYEIFHDRAQRFYEDLRRVDKMTPRDAFLMAVATKFNDTQQASVVPIKREPNPNKYGGGSGHPFRDD